MNLSELWSSNPLADHAVLTHRPGEVLLDNAFLLIEGHPFSVGELTLLPRDPGHPPSKIRINAAGLRRRTGAGVHHWIDRSRGNAAPAALASLRICFQWRNAQKRTNCENNFALKPASAQPHSVFLVLQGLRSLCELGIMTYRMFMQSRRGTQILKSSRKSPAITYWKSD